MQKKPKKNTRLVKVLSSQQIESLTNEVWVALNEAPDIEYRQDMAHDIAEYIVAKVLMDSKTENPDALEAAESVSYMRSGIEMAHFVGAP